VKQERESIEINIYGRTYPLKSSASQETQMRSIEKSINFQLSQYKMKYEQLDKQDCLSMALIESKLESIENNVNLPADDLVIDRLVGLEELLDKALM
jgi:cell division protein ZapA (FtsZ GTPase activity inhibitor)